MRVGFQKPHYISLDTTTFPIDDYDYNSYKWISSTKIHYY